MDLEKLFYLSIGLGALGLFVHVAKVMLKGEQQSPDQPRRFPVRTAAPDDLDDLFSFLVRSLKGDRAVEKVYSVRFSEPDQEAYLYWGRHRRFTLKAEAHPGELAADRILIYDHDGRLRSTLVREDMVVLITILEEIRLQDNRDGLVRWVSECT